MVRLYEAFLARRLPVRLRPKAYPLNTCALNNVHLALARFTSLNFRLPAHHHAVCPCAPNLHLPMPVDLKRILAGLTNRPQTPIAHTPRKNTLPAFLQMALIPNNTCTSVVNFTVRVNCTF